MKRFVIIIATALTWLNASAIVTKGQNQPQISGSLKVGYALAAIEARYVDPVNISELAETAIRSMLKELDPHSAYMTAEEQKRANEPLEGNFDGIGVQFQLLEDTLYVVQTISGCPAEKVGVRAGDRIVTIDGENVAGIGLTNTDVLKKLRGPRGTAVMVGVLRQNVKELIDFKITRDKIPIHSVDASYVAAPNIGYIKLNNFGATTIQEFKQAWKKLQSQGAESLVLDLQGNGGGYLSAAIDLVDEFLDKNKVVVYTEGEHQPRTDYDATSRGDLEKIRLVVLVDEYSASAAEITAGAIQDWDRGVIVGRRTFGKGLVQAQMPLPDGSVIRLTTSRYYTPSGRCIQKPYKGVDYAKDLEERYKRGEFMHADSIHLPDSLRYLTKRTSRTVYGGGGIMPDVFIPADTSSYSGYQRQLFAKGVINKFVTQYIDANRQQLLSRYADFEAYQAGFDITDKMTKTIIELGEKEKIAYDEVGYTRSLGNIKMVVKALIARDLYENQCYFRIINTQDQSLLKAIEILQSRREYERLLKSSL
ncbi:MAG: S41 family peptidase [Paludibacteraceae bacterium]|nr:S41 family peptidase [Paludibacteraceae bacterium]